MLKTLSIRNLAVIDTLDLEFASGFTALTGETGAGKSILIDAIGLAIGLRADAALVRSGCERAEITAGFELKSADAAKAWLAEQELLDGDEPDSLVIRRLVLAEGRTRAFVNGSAVTAGQLRELGERLVDIFGQSESQTLLRAATQRELLDQFGVKPAMLSAVAEAAAACEACARKLRETREQAVLDPAQIDFLRFQLGELEALALAADELDALDAEHRQLAHAGRLLGDGAHVQDALYSGEQSIYDQLGRVQTLLDGLLPLHEGFAAPREAVESALAQLREAADATRRLLERLDLDPDRLAEIERRLGAIHDLARKHRVKPEQLPAMQAELRERLDAGADLEARLLRLQSELDAAHAVYRKAAAALSSARGKAAGELGKAVTARVRPLGLANARFSVEIETDAQAPPRVSGADSVRFDFSANPGQAPRPLARVASGGELSRISLAIQVVALSRGGAPTMIFDEVDAGISGAVAEIVGEQLRAVGGERQVFSVTHLAQVAAQAHAQLDVRKDVRGQQTFTRVDPLDGPGRVEALARLQGGQTISKAALDHARDLLQRAETARG